MVYNACMRIRPHRTKTIYQLFVISLICLGTLVVPRSAAVAQPGQEHKVFLPLVRKLDAPVQTGWLGRLNAHRASANVAAVTENTTWSAGDQKHAIYMVKTGQMGHSENPGSPWYTQEGDDAARNSNVFASSTTSDTDEVAIDSWMLGPFHAAGMLDPRLQQVGFGSYREKGGSIQMAAALNILSGLTGQGSYPVIWPANGKTVFLNAYDGNEYPNPLSSCPGYPVPSGLPLIIQLGPGNVTPKVTAASFSRNGQALEACVFDETTYKNSDPSAQSLGRAVLNMRDTVVLIPRAPLQNGSTYTASITVNGQTYTWSFTVAAQP